MEITEKGLRCDCGRLLQTLTQATIIVTDDLYCPKCGKRHNVAIIGGEQYRKVQN